MCSTHSLFHLVGAHVLVRLPPPLVTAPVFAVLTMEMELLLSLLFRFDWSPAHIPEPTTDSQTMTTVLPYREGVTREL